MGARMSLLSQQAPEDNLLAMVLSVRDSYSSAIRDFVRFLKANNLVLDLSAVKAYFAHLNASALAAGTKGVRRQAVKSRLTKGGAGRRGLQPAGKA